MHKPGGWIEDDDDEEPALDATKDKKGELSVSQSKNDGKDGGKAEHKEEDSSKNDQKGGKA